jgi:hypothetical protein
MNMVRTPYAQMPVTLVYKSIKQKVFRNLHCLECGMPIAQISDKVVMAYDGTDDMARHEPDRFGVVEMRCDRHICKQRYRLEFAL